MNNVSPDPLLDPPSPEYSKTSPALNQGFVDSPEYSKTSPALDQGVQTPGVPEVDPLKEHETRMEFYDAVTMYYGFKTQYQQMKNEMKRKLIEKNKKNKTNKSAESLREEYMKKQPKCINCERKVGTIFETELRTTYSDDDYRRTLVAKCGDKNAPCNLDIQISLPLINTYDEAMQDSAETIDHLKTRIIKIKNDVMFGYEKEETAMKRFTIIGGILADETKILEKLEIDREKSSNERAKKIKLDESDKMMEKNLEDLSNLVDEFETTYDDYLIKDCATLYVDEILKNAKTATENKYDYSEIEYDEDDESFKLTQIPFSLNNKQNYSGEEIYERVLKFVKNDNVSATKLNKTMRKPIASKLALNKTKLKTRKQKIRGDRIKRKQTGSSASEASDSEMDEDSVTSESLTESASLANSETLSSSASE